MNRIKEVFQLKTEELIISLKLWEFKYFCQILNLRAGMVKMFFEK